MLEMSCHVTEHETVACQNGYDQAVIDLAAHGCKHKELSEMQAASKPHRVTHLLIGGGKQSTQVFTFKLHHCRSCAFHGLQRRPLTSAPLADKTLHSHMASSPRPLANNCDGCQLAMRLNSALSRGVSLPGGGICVKEGMHLVIGDRLRTEVGMALKASIVRYVAWLVTMYGYGTLLLPTCDLS